MKLRRPRFVLALCLLVAIAVLPNAASARNPGVVDLDFVGADVRDVLRLLADVGHVNLVIADDVVGKVTLRLKGVRWQRALDVVLSAKGLASEREGNVIRVARLETLAKERVARADAHTACVAAAPLETRLIAVSYANAGELAKVIQASLSRRGSVTVDARTNTLIVTDVVGCD
jgi:type II secretory pathway component HofQ